jgi:flagellum-specific ATP synthase
VSDIVRSVIDGHIILSRRLANRGHYPAIDILSSVSRVQNDVIDDRHRKIVRKLIEIYATYSEFEDMINIGAYVAGSNPSIDRAINRIEHINAFLRQDIDESTPPQETLNMLEEAIGGIA